MVDYVVSRDFQKNVQTNFLEMFDNNLRSRTITWKKYSR